MFSYRDYFSPSDFGRIPTIVGSWLILIILFFITKAFYNVFFHPLAKFPGPRFAAATRLWYTKSSLSGQLPFAVQRLHKQYGSVVRIAPDELSYNTSEAWKDIYGHRSGKPEMPKDAIFYRHLSGGPASVIVATRERHGHLRRLLAHGFSEKALRDQEQEIQSYANLLISRLREHSRNDTPIDMVAWYNYFTFDLIGDLAFGESFGCLESSAYHPWVSMIFDTVKVGSWFRSAQHYPILERLVQPFIPRELVKRRKESRALSRAKAMRRMETKTDRSDFLARMAEADSGASTDEFCDSAATLIIAGSETTATLLSGATYYLLMNRDKLDILTKEIRNAFKSEGDINLVNINRLEYLLACLEESLRVYAPVPGGSPRNVPTGGDTINGRYVPEHTVVSVNQFATYHSKDNFHLPDEFIPERWLGDVRFKDDNRAAHQPFLVGPRNCLGKNLAYLEMKLALAKVLWNFDLEIMDESAGTWDKQSVYLLWEKHPLWVTLKPVVRT